MESDHFKGKTAVGHLAEKLAEGALSSKETHGLEVPGYIHAAADAARDTAVALLLLFTILINFEMSEKMMAQVLALFLLGFTLWKGGRAAWLGWGRLERLHRVLAQEKWEIEHNRPQEREELVILYGAKGLRGKLLEEVVDVLMADEDRLLKIMIEEEMGLSLQNIEHPLKLGICAFFAALATGTLSLGALLLSFSWGVPLAALFIIGASSWITASKADNRTIHAVVWSIGIAILAWGATAFLGEILLG